MPCSPCRPPTPSRTLQHRCARRLSSFSHRDVMSWVVDTKVTAVSSLRCVRCETPNSARRAREERGEREEGLTNTIGVQAKKKHGKERTVALRMAQTKKQKKTPRHFAKHARKYRRCIPTYQHSRAVHAQAAGASRGHQERRLGRWPCPLRRFLPRMKNLKLCT